MADDTHVPRTGPSVNRRRKSSLTAAKGAGAPTVRKPVKSIGRNTERLYDEHGRKRKR